MQACGCNAIRKYIYSPLRPPIPTGPLALCGGFNTFRFLWGSKLFVHRLSVLSQFIQSQCLGAPHPQRHLKASQPKIKNLCDFEMRKYNFPTSHHHTRVLVLQRCYCSEATRRSCILLTAPTQKPTEDLPSSPSQWLLRYFRGARCGDDACILGFIFTTVASTRTISSIFSVLRGGVRTPEGTEQRP